MNAENFKLKNGLEVVVIQNKLSPAVSIGVLYKVGTADDPESLTGISHFLEHMMFKGTKDVPGNQFRDEINACGGEINAWTDFDETFYYVSVPLVFLEDILKKEADRMCNLAFTKGEITEECKVVLEERLMRLENHPFGKAYELLLRALYTYSPYGKEPIGYPANINSYNFQNTRDWYKQWYAPNNAILIVSGNVTREEIQTLAEKYFGNIAPSSGIPEKRVRPQDQEMEPTTQYIIQKNKRNSMVFGSLNYPAPSKLTAQSLSQFYGYMLAAYILGGNDTSLFYDRFVMTNKVVSIGVQYQEGLDPMKFEIDVTLTPDMSYKAFYKDFKDYIKELLEEVLASDDFQKKFEDSKKQIIGNMRFKRDGTLQTIQEFAALARGYSVDDINKMAEHINAVTLADVKEVVKQIFGMDPQVHMIVCPPDYNVDIFTA